MSDSAYCPATGPRVATLVKPPITQGRDRAQIRVDHAGRGVPHGARGSYSDRHGECRGRSLLVALHTGVRDPGQRRARRHHRQRHDRRASSSATSRAPPRPQGFYLQDADRRRRPGDLGRHLRLHRQRELGERRRPRAVTGFARERFNQTTINGANSNTAAVPAATSRSAARAASRRPTSRCPSPSRHPRAVRGHARPLPAAARDLRVLQLRPVRRARAGAAARRRDARRSRGPRSTSPARAANAREAREQPEPHHARRRARAPRTRRRCGTRTAIRSR